MKKTTFTTRGRFDHRHDAEGTRDVPSSGRPHRVTVANAAGARVDKGDLHSIDGDAKHLAVSLGAIPPGTYTVVWRATAVDTHKTEGAFTFTLVP